MVGFGWVRLNGRGLVLCICVDGGGHGCVVDARVRGFVVQVGGAALPLDTCVWISECGWWMRMVEGAMVCMCVDGQGRRL